MASRERYIDPMQKELDAEFRYMQSTTRQSRTVKIEKGDAWLVRFLPVEFGPRRLWYARVAKHWLNRKPITCPKHTSEDYGGNSNAYCPVCDAVDELNQHSDEKVSSKAFEARASAQWHTYCLVISKKLNGTIIDMPEEELLVPYEFPLYKSTWEELINFYKLNSRRDNPYSVLDLIGGCDFWASKAANKPIRLDKQDAAPVLDELTDPPEEDPRITKMIKDCHAPRVVIPTDEQLLQFAEKLHDACFAEETPAHGSGRRRSAPAAEASGMDEAEGAPPTRGRRGAPAEPEADGGDDPAPARSSSVTRVAAGRRAPAPEPEPEPEPEADGGEPEADGGDPAGDPGAEAEAGAESEAAQPPPARGRPTRTAPAPAARTAPAQVPARGRTAAAKAPTGRVEEVDNDPLPEDDRDPVSPAGEAVEGAGAARGRTAPAAPVTPPAVGRSGGNPVRQNVNSRVSAVVQSARGTRR